MDDECNDKNYTYAHIGRMSSGCRPWRASPTVQDEYEVSADSDSSKTGGKLSSGPLIRLLSKAARAMQGYVERKVRDRGHPIFNGMQC